MQYANDCMCLGQGRKCTAAAMTVSSKDCVGCDRCLNVCPVRADKQSSVSFIRQVMEFDCINCGACLAACPAQAIGYQDDTARFIEDLKQGVKISVLAAPAVTQSFADYRKIFGYLKASGVQAFYNVLLRADITIWAYVHLLSRLDHIPYISSPCAAITEYIRYHRPQLEKYLMPVYSPLVCAMIFLQKYQKVNHRLAFLSPCIAKGREVKLYCPDGYNVTIYKLQEYLKEQAIHTDTYHPHDFDDHGDGKGATLGVYGGLSECIQAVFPQKQCIKLSGTGKVYHWLQNLPDDAALIQAGADLAELYNCQGGCEGGTGIKWEDKWDLIPIDSKVSSSQGRQSKAHYQAMQQCFERFNQSLDIKDFIRGQSIRDAAKSKSNWQRRR